MSPESNARIQAAPTDRTLIAWEEEWKEARGKVPTDKE